jgi:hypothetical protein
MNPAASWKRQTYMSTDKTFDFWYAVNNTEVKLLPRQHLETFGNTTLNYHLISELMDAPNRIRVREGRLQAHRPQIITPQAYSHTALDGFGEEARKYIEWLKEHEQEVRILKYGYNLKQEAFNEYILTEPLDAVVDKVINAVEASSDTHSAVVLGVDDPWDVCIVRLFWEVIQESAPTNVRQMQEKHMFDQDHGVPHGVRTEIEEAFNAAAKDPSLIKPLGQRLQLYGLFKQYEDRFFALVKGHRNS